MLNAFKAFRILRDTLSGYLQLNEKDKAANMLASLCDSMFTDIQTEHNSTLYQIDKLTKNVEDLQKELNFKNEHVRELTTDLRDKNNEIRKLQNIIKDKYKELCIVNDKFKDQSAILLNMTEERDLLLDKVKRLTEEISKLEEYAE